MLLTVRSARARLCLAERIAVVDLRCSLKLTAPIVFVSGVSIEHGVSCGQVRHTRCAETRVLRARMRTASLIVEPSAMCRMKPLYLYAGGLRVW
eukprot:1378788-Amphidinium_carterae.2